MAPEFALLALASVSQFAGYAEAYAVAARAAISVSSTPPSGASAALQPGFVSYSIELSSFPEFAGNLASPNNFSNSLLENIGAITGTKPHIRVGGNTQDYALYNANQKTGLIGTYDNARSKDYPTTITIGPSFFESYQTWPNVLFSHGFNLGLGGSSSAGWQTLIDTVPVACKALEGRLLWWEYGNEPDLYAHSGQGNVRASSWNEAQYVSQWLNGTRAIKTALQKACPDMISSGQYGFVAPSFAKTGEYLSLPTTWQDGLNNDKDIKIISSHNYIGGATQAGVSLQGTLMNHAKTVSSVSAQVSEAKSMASTGVPFMLGETNSLYNEGAPGLSNAFGAALWGIDYNLYSASQGIYRVHMHQGTDYRYGFWQPVQTSKTTMGTKPPYYGTITIANMLGDLTAGKVQISNIPLPSNYEAAYAAYVNSKLARILVLNMQEYNYTSGGQGTSLNSAKRPSQTYTFQVAAQFGASASVQRLYANGSDAISGITFDGWSYNYELSKGQPVRLSNVTVGETAAISNGAVSVSVPDSSCVILNFSAT